MVGGLAVGLRHADAARFSFLLATPVLIGAAVLEIPKLLHAPAVGEAAGLSGDVLCIAGLLAALTAYASTAFLMRYFRMHEEKAALEPFVHYWRLAGACALVLLHWRGA
jgi:undecaprenyl-diphosphatase